MADLYKIWYVGSFYGCTHPCKVWRSRVSYFWPYGKNVFSFKLVWCQNLLCTAISSKHWFQINIELLLVSLYLFCVNLQVKCSTAPCTLKDYTRIETLKSLRTYFQCGLFVINLDLWEPITGGPDINPTWNNHLTMSIYHEPPDFSYTLYILWGWIPMYILKILLTSFLAIWLKMYFVSSWVAVDTHLKSYVLPFQINIELLLVYLYLLCIKLQVRHYTAPCNLEDYTRIETLNSLRTCFQYDFGVISMISVLIFSILPNII